MKHAGVSSELRRYCPCGIKFFIISVMGVSGNKSNIVLVGFMGTGKSTVGRIVAERLGMRFIELDSLIEDMEQMSIPEIFDRYGEQYFRDVESEAVAEVAEYEGVVISTGGGVVLREENIQMLRKKGVIVCLTASEDTILQRTRNSRHRPLLNVKDPLKEIKRLLRQRSPYYAKADIMIPTDSLRPEEVAEKVISSVRSFIK